MKSYFADQIEALRVNQVFYAIVEQDEEIEYQKVDVLDIDTLDSALVFERFEGMVPLFKVNSAY